MTDMPEVKIFAETERLILREILPSDVEGMFELDSDPEVHKYLGNQPVIEREQIADVINFIRQQYIDNGIGRWAIIDKKQLFYCWAGLKFVTDLTNNHQNYFDLCIMTEPQILGTRYCNRISHCFIEICF